MVISLFSIIRNITAIGLIYPLSLTSANFCPVSTLFLPVCTIINYYYFQIIWLLSCNIFIKFFVYTVNTLSNSHIEEVIYAAQY